MSVEDAINIIYDHIPYFDKDVERVIAKLRAAEELAKAVEDWELEDTPASRQAMFQAALAYERAGGG